MELYIGRQHGEISLEEAAELMERYPSYAKRAIDSAIKSESWRMKNVIQATIRQGGPGGKWPKLNPHTGILDRYIKGKWLKNYRKSRKGIKRGGEARRVWRDDGGLVRKRMSTKSAPLLKLAGGTRYSYDPNLMTASIGFLSGKSPGKTTLLAKKHALGFRARLTPRARRWAFGLGFPLAKGTTELVIPPRPVVGPVYEREKGNIVRNIGTKVLSNMERYRAGK